MVHVDRRLIGAVREPGIGTIDALIPQSAAAHRLAPGESARRPAQQPGESLDRVAQERAGADAENTEGLRRTPVGAIHGRC